MIAKTYNNINSIKMRAMNTALVFDAIRMHTNISRTGLAKVVGLTTATITNLVNKAISEDYIIETGMENSRGGRRAKVLQLNGKAGYAIGIEINLFEVICIITDFNAKMISEEYLNIDIGSGSKVALGHIVDFVESMIAKNEIPREKIIGIGLASAGPIDHIKGVMINPPNFVGWKNVQIKKTFEDRLGITTFFEKETSAFALCEQWMDIENRYKRILTVNVFKIGIGGGLVLDGDIYHGHKDAGLEIGHMMVDNYGSKCRCGRTGCLEVMADGEAAVRYYKDFSGEDISIDSIIEGANDGEENCVKAMRRCGKYLGNGLRSLISVIAPDIIFIGGDFIEENDILFEECLKTAEEQTYPFLDSEIEIKRATRGKLSGAFGSVARVLNSALAVD